MNRRAVEIIVGCLTLFVLCGTIFYFLGQRSIDSSITVSVERKVAQNMSASPSPTASETPDDAHTSALPESSPKLININTASAEELDTLPGIGPVLAQRIVDYRRENGDFASTYDIVEVRGIGDGIYADLEGRITVG